MRTYSTRQGINQSLTIRWGKSRKLRQVAELPWMKCFARLRSVVCSKSPFEAENEQLFSDFAFHRQARGEEVDKNWLKERMIAIMKQRKPVGFASFKASNGWLQRFLRKYRISNQVQTEKKPISNAQRVPVLKAFHQELMELQRTMGKNVRDPVFGRFGPYAVWNMDQIPFSFARSHRRSYNFKNCYNWLKNQGPSGINKRMCTIILTLRAAGEQIVPPFILFKGKGKLSAEKLAELDEAGIPYGFNENAWANGASSLDYLRFFKQRVKTHCPDLTEHLLLMDNLGSQSTRPFVMLALDLNIYPFYFPANCTHLVQPVDHRIAAWIHKFMGAMYRIEQTLMNDDWTRYRKTKTLSDQVKRKTMLRWVRECWDELKTMESFLFRSFVSTGCLIQLNGTHAIYFQDIPDYSPVDTDTP